MKIAGMEMKNPLMVCSGVLGISSSIFNRLEDAGIGAVVSKSISLEPNDGYENPTMVSLPYGAMNAMGLPNPGVEGFLKEIKGLKLGIPLIISIYGKDAGEFAKVASKLDGRCDALELNLSCPHAGGLLSIGQDPDLVEDVVRRVKDSCGLPVIAKLTPNVADIRPIGVAAENGGADALTAINTVRGLALNIRQEYPILSNVYGGLSGPCIKPIGLRCVWDLKGAVGIPIIGVGGISSWEDVVEYMYAGASAVQIGTVLGGEGIDAISRIGDDLERFSKDSDIIYEDMVGRVRARFD
ncbi:MAG TPA: dihydroorotate dehydrogenase [Candidatus Methanofastidiosa archaeon]|nr:dihydroorotate dehydrogenase [Candidatus Methanofastidiosa archaeon]HPR42114.1 dihydroorotate dehydrogenase [Candidatus Methanofastidiosa archaeon]